MASKCKSHFPFGEEEPLTPGARSSDLELELLTSQHYDFSAGVLAQEGLHEVVAHREQFGGWGETSKDNGGENHSIGSPCPSHS